MKYTFAPESAYNIAEWYSVTSAWVIPGLINCVALVSVLSVPIESGNDFTVWGKIAWRILAGIAFIFYCFIEADLPVWDFTVMAICWITCAGKVVIAYWRRKKNDRTESMERME